MTLQEALALDRGAGRYYPAAATGTDGARWYRALRFPREGIQVRRIEWDGKGWTTPYDEFVVPTAEELRMVDWCPGRLTPDDRGKSKDPAPPPPARGLKNRGKRRW